MAAPEGKELIPSVTHTSGVVETIVRTGIMVLSGRITELTFVMPGTAAGLAAMAETGAAARRQTISTRRRILMADRIGKTYHQCCDPYFFTLPAGFREKSGFHRDRGGVKALCCGDRIIKPELQKKTRCCRAPAEAVSDTGIAAGAGICQP
jgi:hypothetical protein